MTGEAAAAIHRGELARWAEAVANTPTGDLPTDQLARRARATCARIGDDVHAEHRRLAAVLARAGVDTEPSASATPRQRHELVVRVAPVDVDAALGALRAAGYERHLNWRAGAERSARRTAGEMVLVRGGPVTTMVRLRWREPRRRGRLGRLLRPSPADWATITLPTALWWAYPGVRVGRLLLERVGLRERDHADLEPFLATPDDLVDPLLDVAGVEEGDVVVDLGCGDGRIVIAAAERRGCRAIGVEQDATLAADAAAAVTRLGLDGRVAIVHGDGLAVDLADATVVVLFLPLVVAGRVVPVLLERLPPGARLVLHEQSPLPAAFPPPETSAPIVGAQAVTVAHRWRIGGR